MSNANVPLAGSFNFRKFLAEGRRLSKIIQDIPLPSNPLPTEEIRPLLDGRFTQQGDVSLARLLTEGRRYSKAIQDTPLPPPPIS